MKLFKRRDRRTPLEKEIDALVKDLGNTAFEDKEYATKVEQLGKLMDIQKKKKVRISPDTVAIIIANLAGIVLILGYERAHVITTKALGFIIKGRI